MFVKIFSNEMNNDLFDLLLLTLLKVARNFYNTIPPSKKQEKNDRNYHCLFQ